MPAQAGSPTAETSGEELVSYVTKGKLDVAKRVSYNVLCAADCRLSVSTELELKGPDPKPVKDEGQFPGGLVVEPFLLLNKAARSLIRKHIGVAKLRTKITAINNVTGEVDADNRIFKFKR
jgi:hypothetical protein